VSGGGAVTFAALADEAGRMAMLLLAKAAEVEQRRAALARYALVWWQGEAAEAYRGRVQERVAALAALSARLEAAAEHWEDLEEAAEEAALEAGEEGVPWWR
jgi:hypothetical protein